MPHHTRALALSALLITTAAAASPHHPTELVISTQDGKYQRTDGLGLNRTPPAPDSVIVIDTSRFPPKIITTIDKDIEQTIAGPPQSVAITPDGTLALLGAPSRLDATGHTITDSFLQIVDLTPPHAITRLPIGTTIQGIAINPAGTLALACGVDGQVHVLKIDGHTVTLRQTLRLAPRRLASAVFTPDGKHALVSRRDDGGIAVLAITNDHVTDTGQRLASGLAPYALNISADGHWAVTGNVGMAGLPDFKLSDSTGDADTITLYDLSKTPYKAVDFATTKTLPEGVGMSEDGQWIAVQTMDGSFLPHTQPGHTPHGTLTLFHNERGHLTKTDEHPSGTAGQGVVIAHHGDMILVQRNVEHDIAIYRRESSKLIDTGTRLATNGGPVAFNILPR